MTRPKISAKVFSTHQRHTRILTILAKGPEPRAYFKNLCLSRSLKWLAEHGLIHITKTDNVYITDPGLDRLKCL